MTNGVFLIAEDGTLIEMAPAPPESEDRLQALIADYPDLLAGDQIDHGSPRRWLLVSREMAVPDSRAATRWAVDHLFLDQDGVPTLVEVKRHGDTRARRAVVGQMLDYAANAVVHWPVDVIKDRYAAHCAAGGRDADEALRTFLAGERQIDEFWDKVDTNLKEWNLRLIFVADDVPRELQRIVEFLNLQMDRAEVLAVEIKEYAGAGRRSGAPGHRPERRGAAEEGRRPDRSALDRREVLHCAGEPLRRRRIAGGEPDLRLGTRYRLVHLLGAGQDGRLVYARRRHGRGAAAPVRAV